MKTTNNNYEREERRLWIGTSMVIISCAIASAYFVGLIATM